MGAIQNAFNQMLATTAGALAANEVVKGQRQQNKLNALNTSQDLIDQRFNNEVDLKSAKNERKEANANLRSAKKGKDEAGQNIANIEDKFNSGKVENMSGLIKEYGRNIGAFQAYKMKVEEVQGTKKGIRDRIKMLEQKASNIDEKIDVHNKTLKKLKLPQIEGRDE